MSENYFGKAWKSGEQFCSLAQTNQKEWISNREYPKDNNSLSPLLFVIALILLGLIFRALKQGICLERE